MDRRALLSTLTQKEAMRRHEQGRQRAHWRAPFMGLYSILVDIVAPFKPGRCWDPVASGRDKRGNYRYFVASAFSIPVLSPEQDLSEANGETEDEKY